MDPKTKVASLPGVGYSYNFKLKRLGIETVEDLIYHFPFRYDDFSKIEKIRDVNSDEKITIEGVVWQIKNVRLRNGKFITNATVADESGTVEVVWFYQPYLTKSIKAGTPITLSGKVKLEGGRVKMLSPQFEIPRTAINQLPATSYQQPATIHTGRLVPIYPETEGVTSKWLRAKIAGILPRFIEKEQDFLTPTILSRQNLVSLSSALSKIHFPKKWEDIELATKRLAFDELFLIQLASILRKKSWQESKKAPPLKIDESNVKKLIESLPFSLTQAQKKASREILEDLKGSKPQNRLLEGDVGSGKTVVAAIAAFSTFMNGFEVLFAAPTEVLAFQHQKTLDSILSPFGISIGIWTGSRKQAGDITCGTHALLTTFKPKKQVGLIIIDEQHRFGVAQRAKLFMDQTKKHTPHFLTMTATPIPRTLALTLYRDLDLSVLDEMPTGRQKIATYVVPNLKRNNAYKFIEKQIEEGRQAFILTPFVEPSETMASVKSATVEFEKLKTKFTNKVILGLLHGRLKSKEKEKIIEDFKKNKINILVTTPVVEVGIDVPNATVMMIESAERFGLAQLHQLRGRVGRGEHKSYCLLFTDSRAESSIKRLKSMEKVHVGFELAEIDLKMRGAGEVFGLKQSGFVNLKIADLSDALTLSRAQKEADTIIKEDPTLKSYPSLLEKISTIKDQYVQPN